jgi:hypothetical protein
MELKPGVQRQRNSGLIMFQKKVAAATDGCRFFKSTHDSIPTASDTPIGVLTCCWPRYPELASLRSGL